MDVNLTQKSRLSHYFAKHESSARHHLSCSDVEPIKMSELLEMADDECHALWNDLKMSYTDYAGHPLLRKEIAKLHGVTSDETLVVIPREGIFIAVKCLVDFLKKKHNLARISVITTFPVQPLLYEQTIAMGCEVRHWTSYLSNSWQFNMADLRSKVTDDTKLLIVNFPHNPTGFVPTVDEFNEVISFCKSKGIFLFSDEMYWSPNNNVAQLMPSACSLYTDCISLSGLSKMYGLPGLRLGWLCTQNADVMEMMASLKTYTSLCGVAPAEILGIIALRNVSRLLQRTRQIVNENLSLLDGFFSKCKDIFDWTRPKEGTVAFVKLKGWVLDSGNGGASGFCESLIEESGILAVPAKCFEFDDQYVRIGFGRTTLHDAIHQLADFLDKHKPN